MKIFEKETVFIWRNAAGMFDEEYVSSKSSDGRKFIVVNFCNPYEGSRLYKNYVDRRNILKSVFTGDIKFISHPCPKEIRPQILAMLNSGDEDSIKLAEGILKNY